MNPTTAVPLCLPTNCRWDQEHQTVSFDTTAERGRLVLCPGGLDILRAICKPVVVICITGPARSGKSFLLSQILDGIQFEVGHGTTAKTTGIWIASTDKFVTKSGQDAAVILLDTEGLCSVSAMDNNTDATWEKKLFTLSLLISSYFIFNSQGTPTFRDLDKLGFVGKLTDYLKSSRACKKDGRFNPLDSSPDFLWLVRDAHLQPEVQEERCSWGRFLKESVLKTRHDRRNDPTDLIRKAVVKTFGKIDAHGLPFPSADPNVLQNLGSPGSTNMTQPAFNRSIRSVKKKIFAVAKEKTFNGRVVSGKDLADFIEIFVEQLNSETGIIDAEITYECFMALEEAEALYTNQMEFLREKMPCSSLEVNECHDDAKKRASRAISNRTQLSPQFARELYTRKSDQIFERKLKIYQSENQRLSREQCQEVQKDLVSRYFQPIFDDPSKFKVKNVKVANCKVFEVYDLMARGTERDKVRLEMVQEMAGRTLELEKLVMHEAMKQALNVYELEMVVLELPCANNRLNEKHIEALHLAKSTFEELCSGGTTKFVTDYGRQLEADIHDKMGTIAENNDCLSLEYCQKIMDNLVKQHLDPLLKNLSHDSYQTLTRTVHNILESYDSVAVGPRAEFVRKQAERDMNLRLKESQVQIAQITIRKALSIYKTHMQNLTLPCSEHRLYRADKEAREKAFGIFKSDVNNFPGSVIQRQEQQLRWDLDGNFSSLRAQNLSLSRQQCLRLVKDLEAKHGLHEVLGNPLLRDESSVRAKVRGIMRDYKWRSKLWDGPAADEIQKEIQTKYDDLLKQCSNESEEKIAAAVAGIAVAGGLAFWGLSKLFGGKKSDDKN